MLDDKTGVVQKLHSLQRRQRCEFFVMTDKFNCTEYVLEWYTKLKQDDDDDDADNDNDNDNDLFQLPT